MGLSICSLILFFLIHHTRLLSADYYHCYTTGNYTSHSTYDTILAGLLFSLPGQVKDQGGYYSNGPGPYCLGLCRKDISTSDSCSTCITSTTNKIIQNCPVQKEVIAWGQDAGCMVRCSPTQFSQSYELHPTQYVCNTTNVSRNYFPQFGPAFANSTRKISVRAADEGSKSSFPTGYNAPEYFATEESKLGDLLTMYMLGYCLPTLSTGDCTACLQAAGNETEKNCHGKLGATVYTPSCVLRYELYPFYNSSFVATSPPSPSPPSPIPPASSSSSSAVRKEGKTSGEVVITCIIPLAAVLIIIFLIYGASNVLKKKKRSQMCIETSPAAESMESCFEFSFNTIRDASDDFSESNKLGEGGFGVVYKGKLPNGQPIAIKRLTRISARGEVEFKNEVLLVARLHHKNLTRLIGFCLESKERILIYEFAFNGSLDRILFDPRSQEHLKWKTRYKIIDGIARGLLYLHEESQMRIIHRDLKASNVLLDELLNAKISDFGTARLFPEDYGTASKIVGTFGYMAPEYAKFGKISVKVDVFSFGILLLEIVSGRKNNASTDQKRFEHLLSKAWKCWTAGKLLELIDPVLQTSSNHLELEEIKRSIHIGLLCVQENAADRPTTNLVILMLEDLSQSFSPPAKPAYLIKYGIDDSDTSNIMKCSDSNQLTASLPSSPIDYLSVNEVSITDPEPR